MSTKWNLCLGWGRWPIGLLIKWTDGTERWFFSILLLKIFFSWGLERDTESFIYGRTLLQLIGHNKKRTINENEDGAELENDAQEGRRKFCYSHEDCCEEKILEIRLGDCALLEQKNVIEYSLFPSDHLLFSGIRCWFNFNGLAGFNSLRTNDEKNFISLKSVKAK